MRWILKIELKHPKWCIPNLGNTLVIGTLIVFIINMFIAPLVPNFLNLLTLTRAGLANFEVWRLLTFIFVPQYIGVSFSTVIYFYFFYFICHSLTNMWTDFRFTLYFLMGWLCSIISMLLVGHGSNYYIYLSFILAFITIAPDYRINLFFFLPLKAKWLGLLYLAGIATNLIQAFAYNTTYGLQSLVAAGLGLIPYLIFFSLMLWNNILEQIRIWQNRQQWRRKNR